jgi:hypothetical protein
MQLGRFTRSTALLATVALGVLAAALVVVASRPAAVPTGPRHPGAVHGLIEGIATPCGMSMASTVQVEVLRGATIVSQSNARIGANYHYLMYVPPGRYVVRSNNGLQSVVDVAAHRVSHIDLMPGCKSVAM